MPMQSSPQCNIPSPQCNSQHNMQLTQYIAKYVYLYLVLQCYLDDKAMYFPVSTLVLGLWVSRVLIIQGSTAWFTSCMHRVYMCSEDSMHGFRSHWLQGPLLPGLKSSVNSNSFMSTIVCMGFWILSADIQFLEFADLVSMGKFQNLTMLIQCT